MNSQCRSVPKLMSGLLVIAVTSTIANVSLASPQFTFAETQVDALPADVAVTPNGLQGVVRCAENGPAYASTVTVWKLSNGTSVPIDMTPCGVGATFGGGDGTYAFSDRIELTNDRGISIGAADIGVVGHLNTTYIDVFSLGTSPACISNLVITGTGTAEGGEAGDVAITRDGSFGIVNSRNWIHVIDMSNGNIAAAFNIGGPSFGGGVPLFGCNPNAIADSVACTNSRAIVTTTRLQGTPPRSKCWVYIIDLNNATILLEHNLEDPANPTWEHDPHDVAITPDGTMAVVTASRITGLYDLNGATFKGFKSDIDLVRTYRINADSVEVTNERAVTIADKSVTNGTGGQWKNWVVDVFSIANVATGLVPLQRYVDPGASSPNPNFNRAHDLEIAPGGGTAVIRSENENLIVTNLMIPPATIVTLPSPGGANPLAGAYSLSGVPNVFTSDSVVIAPAIGGVQMVTTIGAAIPAGTIKFTARADFFDLGAAIPTVTQVALASTNNRHCIPGDLALTRDLMRVVVRCAEDFSDPGASSGVDLAVFSLLTQSIVAQYGASGNVFGVDSLAIGRDRAISISEVITSPPPGPPFFGSGWVQIINL